MPYTRIGTYAVSKNNRHGISRRYNWIQTQCILLLGEQVLTIFLCIKRVRLRRDHTLSSDLPLMRFFFIFPQQKISSLHTGNETDSEFEVFSKRMTFWNIESNFICFSLHTRSSSCQLGKCTRKLLLIPLIAMKSGNALDLPLSGISLNTSIVLDCAWYSPKQSSIVHTCAEVDYYIYIYLFY